MAFMSKQMLQEEAARLGVDLTGLKYQDQQKAVLAAQKNEKDSEAVDTGVEKIEVVEVKVPEVVKQEPTTQVRRRYSEIKTNDVNIDDRLTDEDLMEKMRGRKTIISPEYHHGVHQTLGYEEDLGEELIYETVDYTDQMNHNLLDFTNGNEKFSSYKVVGTTGKRITATTGLPLESSEISFVPDMDLVPRVSWNGRIGYLYKHHRLPNIKDLLIQSGRYEDFKSRFEHEPAVWYANGLLCCDINLVHSLFDRIEREAQERLKRY